MSDSENYEGSGWDSSQSNSLDDELVEFLSDKRDQMTLDFIKNVHKTFSELQERFPDNNFNQLLQLLSSKSHMDGSSQTDPTSEVKPSESISKRAEMKLKLARQQFEEELDFINDINVDELPKSKGVRDYMNKLSEKRKVNDALVRSLKHELEDKDKQISDLRDRFDAVRKQGQEYLKAWKEAQRYSARNYQRSHDDLSNHRLYMNASPSASFDGHSIPPPPPMDEPQLDEILRGIDMPAMNTTTDYATNNSIQHPEVDELLKDVQLPDLSDLPAHFSSM